MLQESECASARNAIVRPPQPPPMVQQAPPWRSHLAGTESIAFLPDICCCN